ncbi:hypothetical protein ElyMa_000474200 [Elysia marginata]|uniref:G-protein coupled receptors family 1 profile domain-containing protein n=1 Tax=Elysia marginata TaxID=1093978 RepID=A0AAV4FTT3_9GAST|nr:hypothetical protein ElyMa_000474200 [Elysia marginata]
MDNLTTTTSSSYCPVCVFNETTPETTWTNGTGPAINSTAGFSLEAFRRHFILPKALGWISYLYLGMLSLSILIGIPGNAITVAAYARIKARLRRRWIGSFFRKVNSYFRASQHGCLLGSHNKQPQET